VQLKEERSDVVVTRTLTKKTPVGQSSSSPTGAASANTAGFQKEWHCRGLAVTEQAILLVTGTRIWKQTGGKGKGKGGKGTKPKIDWLRRNGSGDSP